MNLLFLLGPSGAGKSTAGNHIVRLLGERGVHASLLTSKEVLGELVLQYIKDVPLNEAGIVTTPHVTVFNPEWADATNFQAQFHDGKLVNTAHELLIAQAAELVHQDSEKVWIVELANGEEVHYTTGEPTRQTARQFIDWMGKYGVLDIAHILHISAPFESRVVRNKGREGEIPDGPFAELYRVDDLQPDDVARFNGRYHRIHNDGLSQEQFLELVQAYHREVLAPQFGPEGGRRGIER